MSSRSRTSSSFWISTMLVLCVSACARSPDTPTPLAIGESVIDLPAPRSYGDKSLEETLSQRRSVRSFAPTPLTPLELGQLLWAAQGLTHQRGFRTAPSAGALYPLELYVATGDGVFLYAPQGHRLRILGSQDRRLQLYEAGLAQDALLRAPTIFVLTAAYERTELKYGSDRTPRYVHLEAGHAAQNLLLQAVALDLGAVPIGAFHDEQVQQALGLPPDHHPLYLIPIGKPAEP